MEFQFSDKAQSFTPNIFNILDNLMKEKISKGGHVFNFSVGTPDFEPDEHVKEAVAKAALQSVNYRYSLSDTEEMVHAVQKWYMRRYGVVLNDSQIMSVAGTQEGMAHIALTICNEGDIVLVPNPGYPIFETGPYLNGAKIAYYNLAPQDHYIPNLEQIPEDIAEKAKMMIVSYPLNPVCTCAPVSFYKKLIAFAKKYNILIVNDNAYSEILYDGRTGFSFLAIDGAMDVGIEFNSLSKSYNLTGLRISYALGNPDIIKKFRTIRSQFDYGMNYLAQIAAVQALDGPQDILERNRIRYQERRDILCAGLREVGMKCTDSEGTMFVWAAIPTQYQSSEKFCLALLEHTGVLCTPGSSFGSLGEGYVRFALVKPIEEIKEAVLLMHRWLVKTV